MKVRESGMPEEGYWETLFNVPLILDRLGVDPRLRNVVEFGCGYGTFTIPVARRIAGTLTTFDIDEAMVERTRLRAAAAGAHNIMYAVRDVFAEGFGVEPGSTDACLLFNILHCEEPINLLSEGARVVRPGGAVLVIHWPYDPATPRGPSLEIRPRPEQVVQWATQTGLLEPQGPIDLPPWHYGFRLSRCEWEAEAPMRRTPSASRSPGHASERDAGRRRAKDATSPIEAQSAHLLNQPVRCPTPHLVYLLR